MAKQRLGKGLGALIPVADVEFDAGSGQPYLPVDLIDPNPLQPRKEFGDEEMADLINSVKAKGILQPVTVRESGNGRYQLVAGERRLRAAKSLDVDRIPVFILSVDSDVEMMEYALVENIQRQDLNPVERAEAFALLLSKFNLTQQLIADQVGMSRPAVANTLRLLRLPSEIKESLKQDEISMGHARALLGLPQRALMQRLWKKIVTQGLSVRQTEAAVQDLTEVMEKKAAPTAETLKKAPPAKPAYVNQAEVELLSRLNTKVRIKPKRNDTGTIEISYYSQDDLDRLLGLILGESEQGSE
ncbi:MAG: ParB/RepB/Spo0J family partition protein [Fidelibacterota bacterium]|nr:MAG: ParB/RepB/Spo0J family partition protein [Candidatus Neomarinimicrobiota bacterium]